MKDLVSIITPVFNAELFLEEMIQSVQDQKHTLWELIIINDGSTDSTLDIISKLSDNRILIINQENRGVSAARNAGMAKMNGEYFCFLDADDRLPAKSISSRLAIFQNKEEVNFVDGQVKRWNHDYTIQLGNWKPNFDGNPLIDLIALTGKSFFGPTWMIKRNPKVQYRMNTGLTHGEDLLFFMELAREKGSRYSYTNENVLDYRIHGASAMQSLPKLEKGYHRIAAELKNWPEVSYSQLKEFQKKTSLMMSKSYFLKGQIFQAIKALL